jgi:hypothetical protein
MALKAGLDVSFDNVQGKRRMREKTTEFNGNESLCNNWWDFPLNSQRVLE